MSTTTEKLMSRVQGFLESESCGHDFLHCVRVANLADFIASKDYPEADREVIAAAALVHDMCRPWERLTGKSHYGDEALEIIHEELKQSGFDKSRSTAILEIVRWHDVYDKSAIPLLTKELRIHQDADRLDAIGAIGIARAFSFGGANNLPIYLPDERLEFDGYFIDSPQHRTSTIAHFHEKLLKLSSEMHTTTGKELAAVRHARIQNFLSDFFEEWGAGTLSSHGMNVDLKPV